VISAFRIAPPLIGRSSQMSHEAGDALLFRSRSVTRIRHERSRTAATARADASTIAPDLRKALMALVVAVAALASAIVLVLIPQPLPYPAQAPPACRVTQAHQSTQVATARPVSRPARSTDDIPNPPCA
jgi:hypothetical protein